MILTEEDFATLAEIREPLDRFGPETERPFLAIRVTDGAIAHAEFIRMLPCPVLAIGPSEAPLVQACDVQLDDESALPVIARTISHAPIASTILVQHLRASERLPVLEALTAESLAYATVQRGQDFLRWRAEAPCSVPPGGIDPLAILRDGDILDLRLDNPAARNAIDATMRDALCEALDLALSDDTIARVRLTATGQCFSTGGEVSEFGLVADPATAHWIRSLRLPATRAAQLRDRLEAHIDGAAIGAGIEIAAFASRLTATRRSWFQLPELDYGLIPGAGGTVSMSRRMGRQRTAWLALTKKRLSAAKALEWGLIDAIL
ncbi:enoyl-CoA hydratase [Croceicoccus estronivorus]|uniref:enoyl-CoA hydratase/isomerase family protein n=1 Tax=Croceicoccus estronivorus TaxID=1172626 RepID=UPI00082CEEAD|nr:enoyl-CoA hydratase/isomerase family protein [Croceicoccus estronivorus]OCC23554.1 enoyl-CoA hydratase [Croceicoccus estronivorus]